MRILRDDNNNKVFDIFSIKEAKGGFQKQVPN